MQPPGERLLAFHNTPGLRRGGGLRDFVIALMTLFNLIALLPLSRMVKDMLSSYDKDLGRKKRGLGRR